MLSLPRRLSHCVAIPHRSIRQATVVALLLSATACTTVAEQPGPGPNGDAPVQLTQVEPAAAPLSGGAVVKLTGVNLDDGTRTLAVSFGGTPATVTAIDDTTADVTVPPAATIGSVDITVSNATGTSTLTGGFTYTCPTNFNAVAGQCVDFATDSDNCGTAGNVCSATTTCLGGTCTVPAPMPTARTGIGATLGPDGKIYVIGGDITQGAIFPVYGGNGVTAVVEVYDPRTNKWTSAASIPEAVGGRSVTTHDGMIHTIRLAANRHYAYDVSSNTWTERAIPSPLRSMFGMSVAKDGRIFLLGGGGTTSDVADAYDPATDKWTPLPAMPTARANSAAATGANGVVYTFGSSSSLTSQMDAFDPAANAWSPVATPTPYLMPGFTAAAASKDGTTIYVVGNARQFHVYDIGKSTWTKGPNLADVHNGFPGSGRGAVVAGDGRLFVVGGRFFHSVTPGEPPIGTPSRMVEVYDPKRNAWIAGPP